MQAKQEILDLWQLAVQKGITATFYNVYGAHTGAERFNETQDAFSREDAHRIVKSTQQLQEDAPDARVIHTWPAWNEVRLIAEHIFDEDYQSSKRVAVGKRDPNVNMYSEEVTPENATEDAGPEDLPDALFNPLHNEDIPDV